MITARVAIVGAPNSGKSTLFNRLLGRRKALVHKEPGMTRDVNEAECSWDGRSVLLQDTGGVFAPGDSVFADLVKTRVLHACAQADAVIFLVDGAAGITPTDEELARLLRATGCKVVVAVNKLDTPSRESEALEFHRLGFSAVVPVSAEHAIGIGELREAVSSLIPSAETSAGDGVEANQEPAAGEIRIAIAGRPNVGKSSLLNKLLGEERSLVTEVPGTTRDAIDTLMRFDGSAYRLIDTAGLRRPGRVVHKPEVLSAMSARRNVEQADVVLVMMDATEAPTLQDLHIAGIAQQASRPFMVLLNKWDLAEADARRDEALVEKVRGRLKFAPYAPLLTISARTGLRVSRVLPLASEIHAQALRRLGTGRLNQWLRKAIAAKRPPATRGVANKFFYVVQTGSNPPLFSVFTNSETPPHFSYRRYLENSLRDHFGLTRTPVQMRYRERPRRALDPKRSRKTRGRKPV